MPDTGISIIWGGVAAAAVTAVAAITSARISRQIKISEFRETRITDLRKDIADYISLSYKWFEKNNEIERVSEPPEVIDLLKYEQLGPSLDESDAIFRLIQLRFNPRDNNKAQNDAFLKTLYTLTHYSRTSPTPRTLDLTNLPPIPPPWHQLADQAVEQAREFFEREWEVTEHPLRHSFRRWWKRSCSYLVSACAKQRRSR